ncbi:MAG: hypothetical protein IAE79_07615 [Anaerolinea sp.]|nr:hypothetical protein [Anaerolinea sp.]
MLANLTMDVEELPEEVALLLNQSGAGALTAATVFAFAKDAGLAPEENTLVAILLGLLADMRLFCQREGVDFGSLVAQVGGEA